MATLKEYIEAGAELAESLTGLASLLGVSQPRLSRMKSGKEHMPLMCTIKLADIIGSDRLQVLIAAEIAGAKNAEELEFWQGIENEVEEVNANPPPNLSETSYIRHMMN